MLVRKTKMMEKEAKDKEREEEKLRSQRERFSNMLGWRQTLQSTEKKQAKDLRTILPQELIARDCLKTITGTRVLTKLAYRL